MQSQLIRLLFFLPLFFYLSSSLAQEKIIFLNGESRAVEKILKIENKELTYVSKKKKEKKLSINKIFAVNYTSGIEEIIYRQDTALEYFLTTDEMRLFIKGEQAAIMNYNRNFPLITGAVFGIAGGLVIPFFATLSVIPPASGAFIVYGLSPNLQKAKIEDQNLLNSPEFVAGFQSKTRTKRLKSFIYGSAGGLTGTLLVLIISGSLR